MFDHVTITLPPGATTLAGAATIESVGVGVGVGAAFVTVSALVVPMSVVELLVKKRNS